MNDLQIKSLLQNTENELKQYETQYIQIEAEILRIKESLAKIHGGMLSLQNLKPILEQWWRQLQQNQVNNQFISPPQMTPSTPLTQSSVQSVPPVPSLSLSLEKEKEKEKQKEKEKEKESKKEEDRERMPLPTFTSVLDMIKE
jgi:DNA repair exonuclease SbcCD ATPase subunit